MIRFTYSIALLLFFSTAIFSSLFSNHFPSDEKENSFSFVILECPSDTSISCTSSTDPSVTGMPTVTDGETVTFMDSIALVCPNKVIHRTWISAAGGVNTDTCVQMITLEIDSVNIDLDPIEQFIGFCTSELDSLARSLIPLNCNEEITNVNAIFTGTVACRSEEYSVTWTIADDCTMQSRTESTFIQLVDMPPLSIANVDIDSADVSNGRIAFDVIPCQEQATLNYAWSNGSTDSVLMNVAAGTYTVSITSSVGCLDTFSFNVPQRGLIQLDCPDDMTVGCAESTDASTTGVATGTGGEISFTDNIVQRCPSLIIERKWIITSMDIVVDSCIQTITQLNADKSFTDSVSMTGICPRPIDDFVQTIELDCSETLDSSSVSSIMETCDFESYEVRYFISDSCRDTSYTLVQVLEFSDVPFVSLVNTSVQADMGDTTGSISFDLDICKGNGLTFAWSNGSTDTTLAGLVTGDYSVTITNDMSCVDSFTFSVPILSQDIICPDDVTISCDASTDPVNTGFPMGGAPEEFSFSDTTIQECPMTIIQRRWSRDIMTASSDMCVQTITLTAEGVRSGFQDTVIITGVCGSDLEDFVEKELPLSCGERIISVTTLKQSESCEEAIFSTTWFGADECNNNQSFSETQVTIFRDISVAQLSNIMITPDPNGNGGAIGFDINACRDDSLAYAWSDGSTTATIDSINSGDYSLTVTNEMGCVQTFDFTVPIFLSLECPDDITIGCENDPIPSVTGQPVLTGFDSVSFMDNVIQDCPSRIIERSWISSISGGSFDTCVQTITLVDDSVRFNFPDTLFISGLCSAELDSFIAGSLPLGCNERIDFMATDPISADCDREVYRTDWLLFDECTGLRTTLSQFTVFDNLPVIDVSNINIAPAIGDSTGAISFDFSSCKGGDPSFSWSTGSTDSVISGLTSGNYTVTISNLSGCMQTLSFDVPLSFVLTCPPDTTVSCAGSVDPSITGTAVVQGFDSLSFVDNVLQTCPNTIIERTWTGSSSNAEPASCVQTITLSNENIRADFQDTIRIQGACVANLEDLITMTPPLRCGESITSQNVTSTPMDCNTQTFTVDWFVLDECLNRTVILKQVTIFEDISVIDISNLDITADQEDTTGAITFDFTQCMGDTVTFEWSNGSTMPNQSNLAGGTYGLTVTNDLGCIDSFTFEVPFLFSLNCPVNISLACVQEPTPDVTGMPSITGYEIIEFTDIMTQMCPDRVIERRWTAMTADSSMIESCIQIITLRSNAATVREGFPLSQTLIGVCTDDVLADPNAIIPLACSEVLDSTDVSVVNRSCEQDVVNFTWFITDMCLDTSFSISQAVIFQDVPVITLDSFDIIPAQGEQNGSINFNFESCRNDSVTFIWNDLSSDPFLNDVPAGEYQLRVTNEAGCRDTFFFIVSTDFTIICPDDISIDCEASTDPDSTGRPLAFGFTDVSFTDSLIMSCPDQVIQRTWTAATDTSMEMCTQMITLLNNDDLRADLPDTITITGQCPGDIETLVISELPLSCNETIDSTNIIMVREDCETAEFAVIWFISDRCDNNSFSVSQTVLFQDIPFVTLDNVMIGRDDGTSSGSVDFDIDFCMNNDLTFQWSDGSSNKALLGVPGGIYMVTITNALGCSEEYTFDVPSPLPFDSLRSLTVNVVDRDDNNFEGLNIRFLSNVGEQELRADLFNEGSGRYIYVFESELSEVGYVCPSFDDPAIRMVSSLDIVRGQRLILGISESCPEDFVATDVNFSGSPSAADLVLIQRVILGLSQSFPAGESWRFVKNAEININDLSTDVAGCIQLTQEEIDNQTVNLKGIKLGNLECPD